eukprot:Gb_02396 [translate_table: standard]
MDRGAVGLGPAMDMPIMHDNDRYELVKDIGSGNFGVARLMRDKQTRDLVAVKYIERGEKIDENVQREIVNHRSLRHPNIVILTPTHLAIVMEYASGGELFERICNAGRFNEDEARFFFQQLISGVSYCHSMQVCHRDLKLENTLLDGSPAPRLKICDFGYSKSSLLHSQPKSTVGTPAYIAPEVLSKKEYDGKGSLKGQIIWRVTYHCTERCRHALIVGLGPKVGCLNMGMCWMPMGGASFSCMSCTSDSPCLLLGELISGENNLPAYAYKLKTDCNKNAMNIPPEGGLCIPNECAVHNMRLSSPLLMSKKLDLPLQPISIALRILNVQYSIPDYVHVSPECQQLLSRIFVANPATRITIPDIRNHEWFLKNLPADLVDAADTSNQYDDPNHPPQSVEEINRIIAEARIPAPGVGGLGHYFGGSLDFDEMDLENDDDADLDVDSSGEFVCAM